MTQSQDANVTAGDQVPEACLSLHYAALPPGQRRLSGFAFFRMGNSDFRQSLDLPVLYVGYKVSVVHASHFSYSYCSWTLLISDVPNSGALSIIQYAVPIRDTFRYRVDGSARCFAL
jgi:hypothetical protein